MACTLTQKAPIWILNRLAVAGDADTFHGFTTAAQGPGFIEWGWPNFALATDHLPQDCGHTLRRALQATYDATREAAARDPRRCKLDFNSLIPVPDDIRRAGFDPKGRAWCREHWGVDYPVDRLSFDLTEQKTRTAIKARGRGRLRTITRPQIIFEFFTRDRAPWRLVAAIGERWPSLDIRYRALDLEPMPRRAVAQSGSVVGKLVGIAMAVFITYYKYTYILKLLADGVSA